MPISAKALESVREISEIRLIPVQLPWGEKADFKGVIDLLTMKAYEGDGKTAARYPGEFMDEVETARMELIEAAAEGEDALLEKYLEGEELSAEEILRGLVKAVQAQALLLRVCRRWLGRDWSGALAGCHRGFDAFPAQMPPGHGARQRWRRGADKPSIAARWQLMSGRPPPIRSSARSPISGFIPA